MSDPANTKRKFNAGILLTVLMQLALGLGLTWLLLQKVALEIHIHQPELAIRVDLTLRDRQGETTYSFNLPALRDAAGWQNQQEST